MNIIITGSLAYDRIMNFPGRFRDHILPDNIHILSVSFVLDRFADRFGGTAGNVAYNLKLLGLEPKIIGAVGGDFTRYQSRLLALGIDTSGITVFPNEQTSVANVITDMDDNQISAFFPGVSGRGNELDLPLSAAPDETLLLVTPSSRSEMIKRCTEAAQRRIPYIFSPGQQITTLTKDELRFACVNSLVAGFNDYEWQLFQEKTGLPLEQILNRGIVVVVTRGHVGSNIYARGQTYFIPVAHRDTVKDPTGAGDAYLAGLAAGISQAWDWQTAGQVASTAASFAVERQGSQEHMFTLEAFNKRYGQSYRAPSPFNHQTIKK